MAEPHPQKASGASIWTGMLNRQEPVEEGSVPAEGNAEVFRRNIVGLVPFCLQFLPLGGKDFRQPFDRAGHELVSLFHRFSGLVHEADLNPLPAGAEILRVVLCKQREVRFLRFGRRRRGTAGRGVSGSQVSRRQPIIRALSASVDFLWCHFRTSSGFSTVSLNRSSNKAR